MISGFRPDVNEIFDHLGYYAQYLVTDVSGHPISPIFKGKVWYLNMRIIRCSETSVNKYGR